MPRAKWILLGVLALLVLATGIVGFLWVKQQINPNGVSEVTKTPEVVFVEPVVKSSLPTIMPTATQEVFAVEPTATNSPTVIPTPIPRILGYKLDGKIDLSSGLPIAMAIYKTDGTVVTSNWAIPIAYKGDEAADVFDPSKGTVKSHIDGAYTATWVHSGHLKLNSRNMFAYDLEKSVWQIANDPIMTIAEGRAKTKKLLGARVVICQARAEANIKAFDNYDVNAVCPGNSVEFTITAAALVEREKTDAYDNATGKIVPWLIANKPGSGFENLKTVVGYLIQTCVGRYSDQKSDGTADYVYNRLVLGLTLN